MAVYRKLARGSMGEQKASGEPITCCQADGVCLRSGCHPKDSFVAVCLTSLFGDNLISVHSTAFGYNKCRLDFALEEALMFKCKSINGDVSHAC